MTKKNKIKTLIDEEVKRQLSKERWVATIDVKKPWRELSDAIENEVELTQYIENLIKPFKRLLKLKKTFSEDELYELEDKLTDLEMLDSEAIIEDIDNFDYTWDSLYDWADYNKVWIKTN